MKDDQEKNYRALPKLTKLQRKLMEDGIHLVGRWSGQSGYFCSELLFEVEDGFRGGWSSPQEALVPS